MDAIRVTVDVDDIVETIRALVECESPSGDAAALERSAELIGVLGRALLGAPPERILRDGVTHLRWQFGTATRVLVLAHHDTVWPIGSLARLPFAVRDGVLTGPGSFDMKTGLAIALHAIATLDDRDGVTLLITGDEETGSASSRELIEQTAKGARGVLVLEAAAPGGALKAARKGVSRYAIHIRGRAAHAGLEPENGVNATVELAHVVLSLLALADPAAETTVTPANAASGTTVNTVPATATLEVDVRAASAAEQQRVDRGIRALTATLADARLEVRGGVNRPPFEASSSSALLETARTVAHRLGLGALAAAAVGGASDGNFTAAMGVPTLDGLGAVGGGAHAESEHVVVAAIGPRADLLAALIGELLHKEGENVHDEHS